MSGKFGDRLMYIDGQFVSGSDGLCQVTGIRGTEEVHSRVPVGTVSDVNRAVNAAEAAQPAWAAISIWERRDVLRKLGAAMRARAAEVLPLEAADTGNTIGSLGRDVEAAANYLDFFPAWAPKSRVTVCLPPETACTSRSASLTAWWLASCLSIIRSCLQQHIWPRY